MKSTCWHAAFRPLAVLALCGMAACGSAAPGDERWDFRFGRPGLDGVAIAAAWHDGQLHVGGGFRIAGNAVASSVARWDGTNFSPLGDGLTVDDVYSTVSVFALASYGGRLYAGGSFTRSGTNSLAGLAFWNGKGWSGVGGLTGAVYTLVSDSTALYVGGAFQLPGNTNTYGLARWSGSGWETFGSVIGGCHSSPCPDRGVSSIAIHRNELFVTGEFSSLAGEPILNRARWTGTRWEPFPGEVNGTVYQVASHDNELFACGWFTSIGGAAATNMARWDGTNWSPVGAGFNDVCDRIYSDGNSLLALGSFTQSGDVSLDKIARWNGTNWSPIGTNIWRATSGEQAYALANDPAGGLYMAGYFNSLHGMPAGGVATWDGSRWQPVVAHNAQGVSGSVGFVYALAPTSNALLVGGLFDVGGTVSASRVGRLSASGWSAMDTGITGNVNTRVFTVAARGTEVFVAGRFTNAGSVATQNIAHWDGTSWNRLGEGLNSNVLALTISGDKLYAGGEFTSAGGTSARHLACWNGVNWEEVGQGLNARVRTLAAHEGRLYVGGNFTNASGIAANRVAMWDGTSWHALGTGIARSNTSVLALAGDGTNLYVGGQFREAGNVAANNIAHWDGHEWRALGNGPSNGVQGSAVNALAVWQGRLFVGGSFTNAGGEPVNGLACWDGTNWMSLGSGLSFPQLTGARARVFALAVSGDELFVGGAFTHAGGHAASGLARYILKPEVKFAQPISNGGDAFTLRLRCVAGLRFRIERTSDFSVWSMLTAGRGENEVWESTQTNGPAALFYRAVIEE